ncbi:hypothetical protein NLG97_g23 [Lecanicillium saksenae]|uniref:Uncharacterized protein n=1 Tax=Lecanicillium saksenae TaxID=468837 RepID=A0ACC1R944_9HYPO|nr:hypothetical protein NLG97_g23 [Lecanicillium saksenae]
MFSQILQSACDAPGAAILVVAGLLLAWTATRRRLLAPTDYPSVAVGLPIFGNLFHYSKDPVSFIESATRKYGTCFAVPMLMGSTIWLRSPRLNKEYLETREDVWSFGDGMGMFLNKLLVPNYFDHLRAFVGSLSRGITRQVTLDYYSEVAKEETLKALEHMSLHAEQGTDTELFEEVSFLVHKIIVRCLMGQDFYDHHVKELFELLHVMEANVGSILHTILPHWVPHKPARELWAARDRVHEIFRLRLQERELQPEVWRNAPDYVAYTLRDPATAHLTSFYAAHHTLLMFAAHTSTVANASWTILELLKSPERLNQLRMELATSTGITESPFLDALVKETGRHYSGNLDVRWARKGKALRDGNIVIPAGTIVSISPYLTHHDPETWTKADSYYPERWIEQPGLAQKLNDGTQLRYIPFGAGSHRCPGEKMATVLTKTIVATTAQNARLGWGRGGLITGHYKAGFL